MLSKIVRNSSNVYKKNSITSCKTTSYADFSFKGAPNLRQNF